MGASGDSPQYLHLCPLYYIAQAVEYPRPPHVLSFYLIDSVCERLCGVCEGPPITKSSFAVRESLTSGRVNDIDNAMCLLIIL